jgi:hypothetical protein
MNSANKRKFMAETRAHQPELDEDQADEKAYDNMPRPR